MDESFSFPAAFDRNIGWLTEWEQQALRGKRVAIAGMGGVGGFHLLSLARFGVGAFTIADFDRFEIANFNRQVGASVPTLGRPKIDVLAEMALGINPQLRLRKFPDGVRPQDVDSFLEGADLFIDGFDFFVMDVRRQVFHRCAELGIPAITAAPVGMGVGLIAFTPDSMGFEDYFRLEGQSELRQYVNFLMGVAPSGIHRAYLVDPGRLDIARKKAPSTIAGVQLAASAATTFGVKLLLGRADVRPAPVHHHYDAYLDRFVQTRLRWGNNGPLQRRKADAAERAFAGLSKLPPKPEPVYPSGVLEEIIHIARWAPSGDNAQPWRFQLTGENRLTVRIADHSADNVYEYHDGQPTLLSAGMLLANLEIAASAFGRTMHWRYGGKKGHRHDVDVVFTEDPAVRLDPLYSFVPMRSVDRRRYRLGRLSKKIKSRLAAILGDDLEITWFENLRDRLRIARLNAAATDIRLRIPETFPVHKAIIDWRRKQSPTGIPAEALGLDKPSLKIMQWAMENWPRMDRFNRLAGTLPAKLQMDYLPGLFCAAHFSVRCAPGARPAAEQLLTDGGRLQRFWLTLTSLGLVMQPSLAPLAFGALGQSGAPFTSDRRMQRAAARLARKCNKTLPGGTDALFLGRIGRPRARKMPCRSTRRNFQDLIEPMPGTE